jgi:hypothetical protein
VATSDSVITCLAARVGTLFSQLRLLLPKQQDVEFGMLSDATYIACVAPNPASNVAALFDTNRAGRIGASSRSGCTGFAQV